MNADPGELSGARRSLTVVLGTMKQAAQGSSGVTIPGGV